MKQGHRSGTSTTQLQSGRVPSSVHVDPTEWAGNSCSCSGEATVALAMPAGDVRRPSALAWCLEGGHIAS